MPGSGVGVSQEVEVEHVSSLVLDMNSIGASVGTANAAAEPIVNATAAIDVKYFIGHPLPYW